MTNSLHSANSSCTGGAQTSASRACGTTAPPALTRPGDNEPATIAPVTEAAAAVSGPVVLTAPDETKPVSAMLLAVAPPVVLKLATVTAPENEPALAVSPDVALRLLTDIALPTVMAPPTYAPWDTDREPSDVTEPA